MCLRTASRTSVAVALSSEIRVPPRDCHTTVPFRTFSCYNKNSGSGAGGLAGRLERSMSSAPIHFSARALHTVDQPISYFMQQAVENPNLISLAAGLVDPGSLPAAEVAHALATLLAQPQSARAALQYGTTQGYVPLRECLVTRTAALDGMTPEELSL